MNIGFDFRMGGSINAGIGRYSFELLKALLELEETTEKNQYFVFYNKDNISSDDLNFLNQHQNITLVPTSIRHYSLSEQILLPRILYKYNLDSMHFPNFNVPILYRKPFVVTIHDLVHHKISGHKKTHLLYFWAYKKIIQHAASKAKKIITISEAAKKDIMQYLNITEAKIIVIYEGLTKLRHPTENEAKEVLNKYLITKPYFLFVGTLERKKNIIGLAQAFDLFLEKYKLDMDLVFAGKVDPHYPEIKYEALDIKNKDSLVFTGFISDHELSCLYAGAYAFANASLNEGFGLPGVEAMAYGLPLLVSNTEVFNEIYDNAALYFDPKSAESIADNMKLIASDAQFHTQMQEKSWQRGQLFDWQTTARETLKVYESLQNTNSTPNRS